MPSELLGAGAIVLLVAVMLLTANVLKDRGLDPSVIRRLAGLAGGCAYLIAVLSLDVWTATAVSAALFLAIAALRLWFKRELRGVTSVRSSEKWGEIAFPLAGTLSLAIGWAWLGDRWLAFAPIAFMAWGDNIAGLTRDTIWSAPERGLWPSGAMLAVCLVAAVVVRPYWIGAAGALAATAAEYFRPTTNPLWDDNWAVVAASLSTMGALGALAA